MKTWGKRKRERYLAVARYFDGLAAGLRAKVRQHTPKRATKPRLAKAA